MEKGMDFRDVCALEAMKVMLKTVYARPRSVDFMVEIKTIIGKSAYYIADRMVEAREGEKHEHL